MRRDRMKRRMETEQGGCKHTEPVCQGPGLTPPSLQPLPANQRATSTGLTCTRAVVREKTQSVCAYLWRDLSYPDGVLQSHTHQTELNNTQQCLRQRSSLFGI